MRGSTLLTITLSLASAAPLPQLSTPGDVLDVRSPAALSGEVTPSINVRNDDNSCGGDNGRGYSGGYGGGPNGDSRGNFGDKKVDSSQLPKVETRDDDNNRCSQGGNGNGDEGYGNSYGGYGNGNGNRNGNGYKVDNVKMIGTADTNEPIQKRDNENRQCGYGGYERGGYYRRDADASLSLFRRAWNALLGRDNNAESAKGVSHLFGYPFGSPYGGNGYPYSSHSDRSGAQGCNGDDRKRDVDMVKRNLFPNFWPFLTNSPISPNGVALPESPLPNTGSGNNNNDDNNHDDKRDLDIADSPEVAAAKRNSHYESSWSGQDGWEGAGSASASASGVTGLDSSSSSAMSGGTGSTYSSSSSSESGGMTIITKRRPQPVMGEGSGMTDGLTGPGSASWMAQQSSSGAESDGYIGTPFARDLASEEA